MRVAPTIVLAALTAVGCSKSEPPANRGGSEVEIGGADYAFQVPASLPAGRTAFRFNNKGKVRHELNIALLKPGVQVERVLETRRAGKPVQALIEGPVGVLFADAGERSPGTLSTDLVAGREYAVICIFRDSAGAKAHFDMGMYSVIRVGTALAKTVPAPQPTDTIIGTDYAFQYRRTLAPGRHSFVFRNDGKMTHQVSIALLAEGVTLEKVFDVEKAGGNVDSLFDGDFGLLQVRGGGTPLGALDVDMKPGRVYVIACFVKDDPKSPEHVALGMYGEIRVSGSRQQSDRRSPDKPPPGGSG